MMPQRIQRRSGRMPDGTKYVGNGSKWGNLIDMMAEFVPRDARRLGVGQIRRDAYAVLIAACKRVCGSDPSASISA